VLDVPVDVGHVGAFRRAAPGRLRCSVDGFAAGPSQSLAAGAYIMGRNMFGPGRGRWDEQWRGWWAEEPPYHAPVFVLTHHPREPLLMHGGTTFTFVTDGLQSAMRQARAAAGDADVAIAGGADTITRLRLLA
jgi:dihydrofolate reductase